MATSSTNILPDFHLLCMDEKFSDAFEAASTKCFPSMSNHTNITIHNCALKFLPEDLQFDAVVSPANSYGRLDGAFDDALARAYGPQTQDGQLDYDWITRKAQTVLYETWRGFAPPGTCTIVPLRDQERELPWNTAYLLLCPTMRIPDVVEWDREVVYECIWSMLCAIGNHNRDLNKAGGREIRTVLMTPLGTGVGRISPQRWAEQCVIAMKQYVEASENPRVWSRLDWGKILEDHGEIEATYKSE